MYTFLDTESLTTTQPATLSFHFNSFLMYIAEDRCHRIGQTNAVNIIYFVCQDELLSVDMQLWNMLGRKVGTLGKVVDGCKVSKSGKRTCLVNGVGLFAHPFSISFKECITQCSSRREWGYRPSRAVGSRRASKLFCRHVAQCNGKTKGASQGHDHELFSKTNCSNRNGQ